MTRPGTAVLPPGTLLRDTYVIQERLAAGGMGEVYRATHLRTSGRLAIKVMAAHLASHPASVAGFCREAAIAAVLHHPHVVQIFDFDAGHGGQPFLVMEYLRGEDLAQHLLLQGPLSLARVVNVVRQIAAALEAAHGLGIVHRDLKPANVMLMGYEGLQDFVKVLDFGVSKICGVETGSAGQVLGTPSYMAPEQAEGRTEAIDARTDQFSLAVLTYVLLTGAPPFEGQTTADVLRRIILDEPRPLADQVPWRSEAVQSVLARAMSKQPARRFARVTEFAEALHEAALGVKEPLRSRAAEGLSVERGVARSQEGPVSSYLDTVICLRPRERCIVSRTRRASEEVTIDARLDANVASLSRVA